MAWPGTRAFEGRVSADPGGQIHDGVGRRLASVRDYVGGAELLGDRLALRVTAQGDDPPGAHPAGGKNRRQADRPVADNRDDIAAAYASANSRMVAGRHHVGKREQRAERLV